MHSKNLKIFLAKLLACDKTLEILPRPPVNQFIPERIGLNPFSINPIPFFNIPETNCSTAHKGVLIIFPTIFFNIFSIKPNKSPKILSNTQKRILIIFLNALCAAGPKKKSSGLSFLFNPANILKSDMTLFIIPVRILFITFLNIL